jgi:hypothetical protein
VNATRILGAAALIAGFAAPLHAQQPAPAPTPNSTRVQVRTMETVFTTAVQSGVQMIAQKIIEAAPGISVTGGVPRAHGYAVDGHGWFFDVEVPELRWNTIDLFFDLQRPQQPQRQVNGRQAAPVDLDTNQLRDLYRKAIRDGLMDAILDFGQVPLKPTEYLTVGVRSADSPIPGLDSSDTVTLVMQITGEDLSLFRQTKITRDEAKKRIQVKEEQR